MPSSLQKNRVRPDPVSCQSCRSKKLKCNRVQPCTNCTARDILCKFLVPPQKQSLVHTTSSGNAELLERIERLEAVALRPSSAEALSNHVSGDTPIGPSLLARPGSGSMLMSDEHKIRDEDSQVLENVGTREDRVLLSLSDALVMRVASTKDEISWGASSHYPMQAPNYSQPNGNVVIFPPFNVAMQLFQCYETYVDHISRILHIPTIRTLIKTVYLRLNQGKPSQPGQAALLLSIFALSAVFYQPFEQSEVAKNEEDTVHLAKTMAKGAFDVLDYARRNTSGTLEDIQAYILTSHVTFHFDGFSARGRLLFATAVAIAKDLCLHKLDANSSVNLDTSIRCMVDREVKRRLFWYLAASDWLLAAISGPQEGTYSIHPSHINVQIPRNCNDDDFGMEEEKEPDSGPQPTSMTYFIEKIRLAHICREIVDTVPMDAVKLQQMPYENIIALDRKLIDFIDNLPYFFRLDVESRQQSQPLEIVYPNIQLQRYCIIGAVHSRRCKLHQRFLLRQSSDPRYAYSRQACLESARTVLHFYDGISYQHPPRTMLHGVGIAMHYMHLAMVVLVMDLCFNKVQADEIAIKEEVKAGLQLFEKTRHQSPLLKQFGSSLCHVMSKHNVDLSDSMSSASHRVQVVDYDHDIDGGPFGIAAGENLPGSSLQSDMAHLVEFLDPSFDEIWQRTIETEPYADLSAWDSMFAAIDDRPL